MLWLGTSRMCRCAKHACFGACVLTPPQTGTVKTGLANIMGNKGAVAVGFRYRDCTTICFVVSHLAARHAGCVRIVHARAQTPPHSRLTRVDQRNANYAAICAGLKVRVGALRPARAMHALINASFVAAGPVWH